MRDIEANPYSPDEARVAKFFFDKGTGGGDDPIGSLMASHDYAVAQRNIYKAALEEIKIKGMTTGYGRAALAHIARAALKVD